MSRSYNRSVLLLGGARSGKSKQGMRMVEESGLRPVYCATGVPTDAEMEARIARHRAQRKEPWTTVEAPFGFAEVLRKNLKGMALLVDCVTFFLNNLFYREKDEEKVKMQAQQELRALLEKRKKDGFFLVLVSNEVGMGIVPETEAGRLFRDLQGWVNQWLAKEVDEVYILLAGIPWRLK
ncbi:MAG: bifunctional adenosylcobinamide kinase/adenosylcobinamide-phosphate guanylyltransferase [Atribacterota bacterium]